MEILFAFVGIILLICAVNCVLMAVAWWNMFSRFYGEPGWKALIPFYNAWVISEYTFGKKFAFIGLLVSLFSFFSCFADSTVWVIATVLTVTFNTMAFFTCAKGALAVFAGIVPAIGGMIVAFSKNSKYTGPLFGGDTE